MRRSTHTPLPSGPVTERPAGTPPVPVTGARATMIVGALTLATFVTALDNTIVNVALPTIQADLGASRAGLEWVVSAYVLAFAGLMFLGGRLADRHGRHRVFAVGAATFAASSALAAFAGALSTLIAARALQGAGAALLAPAALSVIGADLSPGARRTGTGVAMAAAASALALGPVIGGVIVEAWHWHGIFLVNLPAAALSLVLLRAGLAGRRDAVAGPGPADGGPLGLPGILASGVALAAAVYVLIEAGPRGWGSTPVIAGALIGSTALVVVTALARRGRATVIDRTLLRSAAFTASAIASLLWGLGLSGVFFFTSLYLQTALGQSPTSAGAVFVPLALGLVAAVGVVAPLCARFGSRAVVTAGLSVVAFGLAWVSTAGTEATAPSLIPPLAAVGVGSGLTMPLTAIALEAVDEARLGMASSLLAAIREGSGAIGVALIGAVVTAREAALRGGGTAGPDAFVGGFALGLQVAAGLLAVAAGLTFVLLRGLREAEGRPSAAPSAASEADAAVRT